MYHWWSWNRVLHQFSDDTYLLEKTSKQLCLDYDSLLNSSKICEVTLRQEQYEVRSHRKATIIEVDDLYRIDCELSNRIFYLAVELGYSYNNVSHKCGLSEKR